MVFRQRYVTANSVFDKRRIRLPSPQTRPSRFSTPLVVFFIDKTNISEEIKMKLFPLEDFRNHFIREDGVIISANNKERKACAKAGSEHLITCLSVLNKKQVVVIYKLLVKAAYLDYDEDIHDVYFVDGNKHNLHLDNVKIRSKVETFETGEKGIVKKLVQGVFKGWDARAYNNNGKKVKYIGSSASLEHGFEICRKKYAKFMTDELIKKLFNEGKEHKIPLLFK
jgi:hypothetical protein